MVDLESQDIEILLWLKERICFCLIWRLMFDVLDFKSITLQGYFRE